MIRYKELPYGFAYGSADVTRFFSDANKGWVTIGIITPKYKQALQIYVTKTGNIRIHDKNGEWLKPEKK